jgi:hypothetical protein
MVRPRWPARTILAFVAAARNAGRRGRSALGDGRDIPLKGHRLRQMRSLLSVQMSFASAYVLRVLLLVVTIIATWRRLPPC